MLTGKSRSLLHFIETPIAVSDPDGRAVYANPAFESRMDVAAGCVQMNVARVLQQRIEPCRPPVEGHGLGPHAVDHLHRRATAQLDRRRGDAVGHQLPPVASECQLTQLVHQRSV